MRTNHLCNQCDQYFRSKRNLERHRQKSCQGIGPISGSLHQPVSQESEIGVEQITTTTTTTNKKWIIKPKNLKPNESLPDLFKTIVENDTQQTKEKKEENDRQSAIQQQILLLPPDTNDTSIGHFYFGRKYLYLIKGIDWFKMGITEELNPSRRVNVHSSLGKNHQLKLIAEIKHLHSTEKNMKKIFQILFGPSVDGTETFEGNGLEMIQIINQYINHYHLYC